MVTKGTVMVAIALSLSFMVINSTADAVFAVRKFADNMVSNVMVQSSNAGDSNPSKSSANAGNSTESAGKTNGISTMAFEELLRCEYDAAANGDLKRSEVRDCYLQAFTLY